MYIIIGRHFSATLHDDAPQTDEAIVVFRRALFLVELQLPRDVTGNRG